MAAPGFSRLVTMAVAAIVLSLSPLSAAEDYRIGGTFAVMLGSGEPTNDMQHLAVAFQWLEIGDWYDLELAMEIVSGADFERPYAELNPPISAPENDSSISATRLRAGLVQPLDRLDFLGRVAEHLVAGYGAGVESISVDSLEGTDYSGTRYSLKTDAGTSLFLWGSVGWVQEFDSGMQLKYAYSLRYHLSDWDITDSVGRATGSLGSYITEGLELTLGYGW